MNKIYTLFIALSLLVVHNMFSQGPWTFTDSNDGWTTSGSVAILTTSDRYSILDVNGAASPLFTRTDANVDGTTNIYAVIRIKNNTSNTLMRFIYNTTGTNRFVDSQISANDTNFKTYYVKVDANADWNTNPVNTITIQFKADHTNPATGAIDDGLGNFYIDHFEIVAAPINRADFSFDNPNDPGGMVVGGGALLTQNSTTGVYELDTNEKAFPSINLTNTFQVDGTNNKFVAITFDSHTATNLNEVSFVAQGPTNQFRQITVAPNTPGETQTIIYNLSAVTSWSGNETAFFVQFRYKVATTTTPFPDGQAVRIHRILFFNSQWTGATDSDWNTASNWSSGSVPTADDVVHIRSGLTNNPVISATTGAEIKDLIVQGTLTIENGGSLIVNGTSTGIGNITYNRTLDFVAGNANGWHLIASPLAEQMYNDAFATANNLATSGSRRGLAYYNDALAPSSKYTYLLSDDTNSSSFNSGVYAGSGIGYSAKRASTGTVAFTGKINTNHVNGVSVSTSGNGFNLLGVPYTSYISSQTFLDENSNLDQTQIWVWKQGVTDGNFIALTSKGDNFILAPGQGFFVKATSGSTVNFSEANQKANTDTFQKSSKTEVKLLVTDQETNRFAKLYFVNNVTKGFDAGWEGETFGGIENSFEVFSHLVEDNLGKTYQVQSLPLSEIQDITVPIGVKAEAGKEITFTTENINLPDGIHIFLEDRLNNTFTQLDIVNSEYKVTLTEALNGTGRFYLHTKNSSILNTDSILIDNVSIYKLDNNILRIAGLERGNANIKIFNTLGKNVFSTSFEASNINDIPLTKISTGVYIVNIETAKGNLNKKIVLE